MKTDRESRLKPEEVEPASDVLKAHHGHHIEQSGHTAGVTEMTRY